VLDAQEQDNRLLERAVQAQLAVGKGAVSDALMPKQEALALADRRDDLQRELTTATAQLTRWIGEDGGGPLHGEPPGYIVDAVLLRQHISHHPELLLFQPMEEQAQAAVHAAEAARKPDWSAEFAYQHRGPAYGDMISFQVTADLPLFTGTRQNPLIRARERELQSIQDQREDMLRDHRATLETDIASATALHNQLDRLDGMALPLAAQRITLQMAAYQAGRGDLAAVLAARREQRELLLQRLSLQNQYQVLATRLHIQFEDSAAPAEETAP
jgi:outer membrane protein TolC